MTESPEREQPESHAPWFVHLGMPALIAVSVAWCATILLGFLLGMSFGRHQGIESALEDYGQEAVRIPLPSPAKKEIINLPAEQSGSGQAPNEASAAMPEKSFSEGILSRAPNQSMSELPRSLAHPEAELLVGNLPAPAPATPPKSEKPAERPTIERNLPEPPTSKWIVQAATFRNKALANTALKKIQGMKIPVLLDEGQRDGVKYFRVILGPFSSSEKATTAKKQVIRSKVVRGELYVKQLGSH